MPTPGRDDWETAALRLLDDPYVFVMTGPRQHADWHQDVLAVMERSVVDPRGWITLDWDKENEEARVESGAAFPFLSPTVDKLVDYLLEIGPASAATLLVCMMDDWFDVRNIPDFPQRKDSLLADARTLLARYGADSTFWTTSGSARTTKNPDFFLNRTSGGVGFTDYLADLGLVVVSDTEVGVFWAFNAN